MKSGSKKLPPLSLDDLSAALLLHTFIFSSSRQMCEQCPRLPLSMFAPLFSSFHSVDSLRFINQTDPPWGHTTCSVAFHLTSFPSVTTQVRLAGLTHSQTGWKDSEGGLDGEGDVGEILELITETEPASVCVHVNLYSSPPTMSCCFLVPFTLSSLWR